MKAEDCLLVGKILIIAKAEKWSVINYFPVILKGKIYNEYYSYPHLKKQFLEYFLYIIIPILDNL